MWPGDGHESAPDLAAFFGAHRNVLQVRLGGGEAPGWRCGKRVGCVQAVRLRIDVAGQRVRIGRAQLGDLSPFEDFLRQRVALLGQLIEHAGACRPLSALGLGATFELELAEQQVAELLGAARIDWLAGDLLDFVHQRQLALREFAREPRQHLPVDRDAAPLHARQHRRERPFQGLVDGRHVLGGEARPQHAPDPQGHVGAVQRNRRRPCRSRRQSKVSLDLHRSRSARNSRPIL